MQAIKKQSEGEESAVGGGAAKARVETTIKPRRGSLAGTVEQMLAGNDRTVNPETGQAEEFVPLYQACCRVSDLRKLIFGYQPNVSHLGTSIPKPRPILGSAPLTLYFRAPADQLFETRILFATYARANSCRVRLELFEQSMPSVVLRSFDVNAREILDNHELSWSFEPLSDSQGQYFGVRISSVDATPTNHVAVWGRAFAIAPEDPLSAVGHFTSQISTANFERRELVLGESTNYFADEVFVPLYRAESKSGVGAETSFGWEGNSLEHFGVPLHSDRRIEFAFLAPADDLGSIAFRIATRGRNNSCRLAVQIFELNSWGEQCHRVMSLWGADFVDNSYVTFDFQPIPDSKGKWFKVYVTSPDASGDEYLTLFGAAVGKDSTLYRECEADEERQIFSAISNLERVVRPEVLLNGPRKPRRVSDEPKPLREQRFRYVAADGVVSGAAASFVERLQAEVATFEIVSSADALAVLKDLPEIDFLLLGNLCSISASSFDTLKVWAQCARQLAIPVVGLWDDGYSISLGEHRGVMVERALALSDYLFAANTQVECFAETGRVYGLNSDLNGEGYNDLFQRLWVSYRKRHFPQFAIVAPLFSQGLHLKYFLDSIARQNYRGTAEIVFVDDRGGGNERAIIESFRKERATDIFASRFWPAITVLENEANLGNCVSRNRAIATTHPDVYLFVDADSVLGRETLEAHARAYAAGDTDVVVGYSSAMTHAADPFALLGTYESDPEALTKASPLRDRVLDPSFLNCSSRAFSVRAPFLGQELFDEALSYSHLPTSGYGYDDVEFGFRLAERGARFAFAPQSIAAEISDSSTELREAPEHAVKKFRNFVRLIQKHPRLVELRPAWLREELLEISSRAGSLLSQDVEMRRLDELLAPRVQQFARIPKKPLRVLTYRWHCAHQYELYKLPHEFYLTTWTEDRFENHWEYRERPLRRNAHFVSMESVNQRDYDVALLHFDENVLAPENCRDRLPAHWGEAFRSFVRYLELPKVAICHGTPQFVGQFCGDPSTAEFGSVIESEREKLVRFVGDMPVVVNSHQAQAEWGFANSRVVWHGFDALEFPQTNYSRQILTLGAGLKNRPHYRGYELFKQVRTTLPHDIQISNPLVTEPDLSLREETNDYAWGRFKRYREDLGKYSIYFNPTLRSPMPRLRGEALLSGLVVVTAANHDVEMFIENGKNGFYSNDPKELARILVELATNPVACREIGTRGRRLAEELFSAERFREDWQTILKELL